MFLFHFFFFSSSNFLIVAVNFSPADLIFSSSACTRKFILLSFADAQVSISPLTDYTSRFRSTSFRYSIRFAIPYQPIRRLPDCQFIARSLDRLLALSLDRSVDRSVAQSLAPVPFYRSVVQSVDQSPSFPPSPRLHTSFSLPFPVHISPFALPIWIC